MGCNGHHLELAVVSARRSLLDDVPPSTRIIRTPAIPLAGWLSAVPHHLKLETLQAAVTWPDGKTAGRPSPFSEPVAVWRERPDVIFSTSAPFGAHLVALTCPVARASRGLPIFATSGPRTLIVAGEPRVLKRLTAKAERSITGRPTR